MIMRSQYVLYMRDYLAPFRPFLGNASQNSSADTYLRPHTFLSGPFLCYAVEQSAKFPTDDKEHKEYREYRSAHAA
jgi:hypothetical protein